MNDAQQLRPDWLHATFALAREAWRDITLRTVGWTVAGGLVLCVIWTTTHQGFFIALHEANSGKFNVLLRQVVLTQVFALTFVLCVLPADLAVVRGAPRLRTYLILMLTIAVLFAAIEWAQTYYTGSSRDFKWWWRPVSAVYIFICVLVLGGPIAFVYTDWQRARRSAARLHAAGLARTRAARDILQTRLQSMQARVEPQFLFDTLARVRNQYDRDPAQGERTLDALIAYLRTAMPRMRDVTSTLRRECELIRTYVDIVAARGDARLRIQVVLLGNSPQVGFPSMLLLPLVEVAVAQSRRTPLDDNAIEVRAEMDGGRVRVSVTASNTAFVEADASINDVVGSVRERLRTLFDADAQIELRAREGGGSQATLELPHDQR